MFKKIRIKFSKLIILQDKSGTITVDELKKVLSDDTMKLPDSEVQRILAEVDLDKNNQIDYNEFLEMMKKDLQI